MTAPYLTILLNLADASGTPLNRGLVTAAPSAELTSSNPGLEVPQAPVGGQLTGVQWPSVSLLPTDTPGVLPSGWAYTFGFVVVPGNPPSFDAFVPAGPVSFTATEADPCVLTWTPTDAFTSLPDSAGVQLSESFGGFEAGTTYYVVNASGYTAQLAATVNGTPLASTSSGSGSLTVSSYLLSSLSPVSDVTTMAAYFPLPAGTPGAGQVPTATGSGTASRWGPGGGVTVMVPAPAGVTATDTPAVTAAISSLVTALGSGPATLLFQDGTYQIDSNSAVIRSVSNFTVKSAGRTVISQAPNRSGLADNITGDLFIIADCTDFRVEGITFDGMRDTVAPITVLSANASSGQPSVTVASGSGARYMAGQRLQLYGGLYANGGTQSTNTLGSDADKSDQNLVISSITAGGGSGGGDLITFTANLANAYTAAAGTISDGFGPYAAVGAYLTPYQTASGNSVAGRTGLGGEDQQNGLHLLNCQRFSISATARNVWESPIKLGTGFGNSPLGDACSDGDVTRATCYHGYDQGVSVWVSQRITVQDCTLISTGWAGISFTHSDQCTAVGNRIDAPVYRPPGDTNSGSGIAVEGGDGCVITGNQIGKAWCNAVVPRVSPLSFGVNTSSPPTLSAQVNAGTPAGTSIQVSASSAFTTGATYCLIDAERTEKIGIASVVDGTHVTFDRITRFTHASGVQVNAAVATDTLIEGNNCRDTQVGSLAEIESSARTILRGNNLIGSATLPGLASPFSFGVNCSQTGIGASTLGGEGSVIEGNVIGRTSNEGIYINNTNRVKVRGNTIGPSAGGSYLIHETGTSDWNRIEGNILDSEDTSAISWAGPHTVVRRNDGRYRTTYELAVAADSPSMWWKLDDASGSSTAADNSGNGHTGTAANVTLGVPGPLIENSTVTAGQFNGSSSGITSTYQAGSQTALSVEVWINSLGGIESSSSARVVCNSHTDGDHNGFQVQAITSGGIMYAHVNMGNGTSTVDIGGTVPMPSAGWVHLVATYGGTTLSLYQNGFLIASGALAGPVTAGSAAGAAAGYNPVYSGDYYEGLIAQYAIYAGTTLSPARVQAHYMAGAYA